MRKRELVEGGVLFLCLMFSSCPEQIIPDTLKIQPDNLPNAIVGQLYQVTLSVNGGLEPYTWSMETALDWLSLKQQNIEGSKVWKLMGTPPLSISEISEQSVKVQVTAADDQTASKEYVLKVVFCEESQDNFCSDHGACDTSGSCNCYTGYAGKQCADCDEGYERTDQDECVRYEYQCTGMVCGADPQQRECVGDNCEDWVTLENCADNDVCWVNQSGVGCTQCELGCSNGACNGCVQGPCCDDQGNLRATTYECDRWTEYRCSGSTCGGNGQEQEIVRYCSGNASDCVGEEKIVSSWSTVEDCNENQLCKIEGSLYPTCETCEHGCGNGACWPECDPASDGCCDSEGREYCWYDEITNLAWQNPPHNEVLEWYKADDYCTNLALKDRYWRLPTISELRSLIRGCAATETGGSCQVTDSCLGLECLSDECIGCDSYKGPGEGGCYWDPGLEGTCHMYWSSSFFEGSSSRVWSSHFGYGKIISRSHAGHSNVRCVSNGP